MCVQVWVVEVCRWVKCVGGESVQVKCVGGGGVQVGEFKCVGGGGAQVGEGMGGGSVQGDEVCGWWKCAGG